MAGIALKAVRLIDWNQAEIESWTGWLVPQWIGGLPNQSSCCRYELEIEGMEHRWTLAPGDLEAEVWDALMRLDRPDI